MQSIKVIVLLMLQLMEDLFTFDYDKRKKYIFISMIIRGLLQLDQNLSKTIFKKVHFWVSGTVFSNLVWYRRSKDLEPLFDPKPF